MAGMGAAPDHPGGATALGNGSKLAKLIGLAA
jgi:hypothetical protein